MRSSACATASLFLCLLFSGTSCTHHQGTASIPENDAETLHTQDDNPAHINVINDSAEPIQGIYFVPSGRSSPKENALDNPWLRVGKHVEISSVQHGTWDIYIEDRTGRTRTYTDQHLRGGEQYHLIIDAYDWH